MKKSTKYLLAGAGVVAIGLYLKNRSAKAAVVAAQNLAAAQAPKSLAEPGGNVADIVSGVGAWGENTLGRGVGGIFN